MANKRKSTVYMVRPLAFLCVVVVGLIFLASWSFRKDHVIAGAFNVDELQICEELDDDMDPINIGRELSGNIKQVCLWFRYSRARAGDMIEIDWTCDNAAIQKETFKLENRFDTRAFYLMKEDGGALPAGNYSVSIVCNGREASLEHFTINPLSGDGGDSDDEPMD